MTKNPLWGAPRIHGELLMLGIDVAESTVGRYMVRRRRPPSQGWRTFLRNHAAGIASLDLFVVRTISFKLLYGLVILRHARRRLVAISVTSNPTAEWIAGQVTDAFPWDEAPSHLIRDRDGAFGPGCIQELGESPSRTFPAPTAGSAAPGAHPRPAACASAAFPSVPYAHSSSSETLLQACLMIDRRGTNVTVTGH